MSSRRSFLKSAGLLAASLPLLNQAGRATPVAAKADPGRGILFDAEDLPRIRANLASPRFAELRALVLGADLAAEERFLREELRLENLIHDMPRARKRLEYAAFAYALTKDPAQLALARLALERLCDYQRWDYFLEGGRHTFGLQRASEANIACVLALDWLGDALPAEERARAEHAIATKGAPACYLALYGMKYPDRVRGWTQDPREDFGFTIDMRRWPLILNATNLKVIPTCGLGYAALALQGKHPEADKWLDMARQSARAYAIMYGTDGAFDEGPGYWGYTTMHLILFAEALHRRTGIDDRSLINYPGTVRYALSLAMPTRGAPAGLTPGTAPAFNPVYPVDPAQDVVNFGDAGSAIDVSIAPWVAHTHDDPLAAQVAGAIGGMKHLPAAIWYRPEARTRAPGPELLDVRLTNDLVVSRSGWGVDDGVLALRSGGPANHEHADRNSFVFKVHGERLCHDPFRPSYVAAHPRWRLRLTEAHTAVLIGGKGHQYHDGSEGTNSSWASARVTDFRTGDGWMKVTSDATEAYQLVNPAVARVERTLVYLKPDVLLVLDRVRLTETPLPVQVRFQVYNDDGFGRAEASGTRFTITRPHATLSAVAQAAGLLAARAAQLDLPATEGVYPFAELESAAALEHAVLTVATAQKTGEAAGTLAVERTTGGWTVRGEHGGRAVDLRLTAAGDEPPVVTL